MLWSQYKLATIRRTEFLRKEITGIPNIANRNSEFFDSPDIEISKKHPTGIFLLHHLHLNKNRFAFPLANGANVCRIPPHGKTVKIT
jgi:hypothetical protein